MIVAFSTSSAMVSVAVFDADGNLHSERRTEAPMAASGACISMLREIGVDMQAVSGFLTDLGPGSFTGVKVGVMLAKAMAFVRNVPVAGTSSFNLIDAVGTAFVPSRKAEFLLRRIGKDPERVSLSELEGKGYGTGVANPTFPAASEFKGAWDILQWIDAGLLLPEYVLEPSISVPNKPYSVGGNSGQL